MSPYQILRVGAQRQYHSGSIALYLFARNGEKRSYVKEIVFEPIVDEGANYVEPSFRMATTEAQQLMDELWSCGLRPSEGTGSAGSLAATERHLKDLQRLVFERLVQQCNTPPRTAAVEEIDKVLAASPRTWK